MISSTVTSLTVLLIVVFLFKEGFSLFDTSPVENHTQLYVNKDNPVIHLNAVTIKKVFDQEITNWKELGGKDAEILLFNVNDIGNYYAEEEIGSNFEYLPAKLSTLVDSLPNILAVISDKYTGNGFKGKLVDVDKNNLADFVSGKEWFPTAEPAVQLGVLPLILGTLLVSFFAIIFCWINPSNFNVATDYFLQITSNPIS